MLSPICILWTRHTLGCWKKNIQRSSYKGVLVRTPLPCSRPSARKATRLLTISSKPYKLQLTWLNTTEPRIVRIVEEEIVEEEIPVSAADVVDTIVIFIPVLHNRIPHHRFRRAITTCKVSSCSMTVCILWRSMKSSQRDFHTWIGILACLMLSLSVHTSMWESVTKISVLV